MNILSRDTPPHHRSAVTYPCSSPSVHSRAVAGPLHTSIKQKLVISSVRPIRPSRPGEQVIRRAADSSIASRTHSRVEPPMF